MKALTPLLNVEDAARRVSFYCEMLGFHVDGRFECDGELLWARNSRGLMAMMINVAPERSARGARPGAGTYDDIVLYFSVDDAQALHRDLRDKGLQPRTGRAPGLRCR